ncbi:PREDICTED: protein lifeguard 1-like isoform X1 [Poecilia mexicana]|uniref:protein lifeguard 1-like isoform X1 n=2 Tax=Poecilia mexicana TaxID=48701 RepID=UPI00072DEFAA|nr:PREDICTED: protein lifeguard 1-like isoform X1 [Poecilia mexicana]
MNLSVSAKMADQREPLIPKPPPGASSPPPYSYHDQPPPAYSAAPVGYGPCQSEAVVTGYQSFQDINPEIASDTTISVSLSFEDETVRRGFARKVFSILTLQLLFTFSVVCVFTFSSVVKEAVQNNLWAYLSSFIVFIVVAFTLSCCRSFSRRHPWNLVGLVIVTLSLSYMVGTVASFHNTTAVVITMAVTLVISLAIIVFASQTRYDFTIYYGVLLSVAVDVIMFGFICTFYYSHVASIIYGCLGALLYSLFLLVDCQLMMGKMSYRLNPEEYVNAALTIYLDIILIFLYLLGRR